MLKCLMPPSAAGSSVDTKANIGHLAFIRQTQMTLVFFFLCFFFIEAFTEHLDLAFFFLFFFTYMKDYPDSFISCPFQCHYFGQHSGYLVYCGTGCRTLLRAGCKRQERREQDQPVHHIVSRE